MLLKIIDTIEDKQFSIYEISGFYSECNNYIEGTYGKIVDPAQAEIILQNGLVHLADDNPGYEDWERIEIMSDSGFILETFNKEAI
ncbi:hypothetical protein LCGC14_2270380 [marine sediment metagenome]|uniref:Uncharacterized protein n=1 Tax=marine sediment metagenome TaxID=412755 RepID=A0A0F9FS80_9ZZZZ